MRCSGPDVELTPQFTERFAGRNAGAQADVRRPHPLPVPPAVLPDRSGGGTDAHRGGEHRRVRRARDARGARVAGAVRAARGHRGRGAAGRGSIPATRAPAPPPASTRSCCPIRCTSPSTTPSRPPGPRTRSGSASCSTRLPSDGHGSGRDATSGSTPTMAPLLDALVASYREWGGTRDPPPIAIVDWRNVPTWTEFEILRDAFDGAGRAHAGLRSA